MSALRESDLELTPSTAGKVILVPVPRPTPEIKKKLQKMAANQAEEARIEIRKIRRNLVDDIKKKGLPQDEDRKAQKKAQDIHDDYMKQLDAKLKSKEAELTK